MIYIETATNAVLILEGGFARHSHAPENCAYNEGLEAAVRAIRALPAANVSDEHALAALNVFHVELAHGRSGREAMQAAIVAALGG